MTRYTKDSAGKYVIKGKKYEQLVGSRAQVMHGTAYKTPGGLKHEGLIKNKSGRFVSKKKHVTAKKENRLVKHGYGAKKGTFGYVKIGTHKSRKSSKGTRKTKGRKLRGGNTVSDIAHGAAAAKTQAGGYSSYSFPNDYAPITYKGNLPLTNHELPQDTP